jgi:tetratricopeptide (TPR) repeat protein
MPSPHAMAPMRGDRNTGVCRRFALSVALSLFVLAGCDDRRPASTAERAEAAKTEFESITRDLHLPSAEATGPQAGELRRQAAARYESLLRQYGDQEFWAAQALRSLANIRAAEGDLNRAVRLYTEVEEKYPNQDWEILQAWKSAADLLWEAGRQADARSFYRKIVARFDSAEEPALVQTIVRASKRRLAGIEESRRARPVHVSHVFYIR